MNFNRRFHESSYDVWDKIIKENTKFSSFEDYAWHDAESPDTLKGVLRAATTYPMIGDVDMCDADVKGKRDQIEKGFCDALDKGYVRKAYCIDECSESDCTFLALDMDVDKVAECCGMPEDEFATAINLGDPMPMDYNTLYWCSGMQVHETYKAEDKEGKRGIIDAFVSIVGVDDDDAVVNESTKRAVDAQISNLKESIFKAKRTLARLQNMKESDESGSKKDMLRKITSAWGQEVFGYAPAVTFLDDDNFDIKFKSHEDAEQFADLWSEALDFSYDDYIENAENMSYSPIDEDTYDNLQKIYDKIVGETTSVEDFGVGSAEYELAENIDGNVIHSYFSNF